MKISFTEKTTKQRSFLEKLTVLYAPHDEIIRKGKLDMQGTDAAFDETYTLNETGIPKRTVKPPKITYPRSAKPIGNV